MKVNKKFIPTLGLIVIMVGLFSYIQFFEKPKIDQESKEEIVVDLNQLGNPTSMEFKPRYGEVFKIVGSDESAWIMSEPFVYKIDRSAIGGIMDVLAKFKKSELVENGSFDKDNYGLKDPAISLTISFPEGTKKISIGDQSFDNTSRYVELDDNGNVISMAKDLLDPLMQSMNTIVDKHLLDLNAMDITELSTQFEGKDVSFIKNDGVWASENIEENIDQNKVDELITNIFSIKANSLERIDEEFDATLYDDPIYLIDSKVSGLDYAIKAVRKPGSGEVLNVKVFETGDGVVESSVGQELNTDNKKLSSTDFVFEIYENEFKELFKDGEEYLVVE